MPLYERTATFDYDDFPGLEVVMRVSIPLATHLELDDLLDRTVIQLVSDREAMTRIADLIDEHRVSWTLDGPAMQQPPELLIGITVAWWRGIRQVPPPLPRRSGDIAPSPVPSPDPESSPEPT